MHRIVVLLALIAVAGCARGETMPVYWPREQWVIEDIVGLAFAIPGDWLERRATTGLIASGPEGAATYYTTLTVQTLEPAPTASFASLLDAGYTNDAITDVSIVATRPCVAGDALALCYDITFDVFDEHRHRMGALINVAPYVVDVSYLAPAGEFDDHLDVLERVVDTLYIEPAG